MGANTGLPAKVSYSAYNTNTQQFVAGDEAQHSLSLRLDGVSAAPTNSPVSVGNGVYEITLTAAERLGVDLVLSGSSSTADIIICPIQFSADGRWNELLEDDGSGNLRNTVKSLEQAPVADVSLLALEVSVQTIITTGGAGPWTSAIADVSNLALESSVQLVLATGGVGPWTTYGGAVGILDVNVKAWQGIELDGINMIENHSTVPRWTQAALALAPAGSGSVSYVSVPVMDIAGFLEIYRGDTLDYDVVLGISLEFSTDLMYAIKENAYDLDSEALLLISQANGLEVINKEVAETPTNAEITIDATRNGVIRIRVEAVEMAKLPIKIRGAFMDIQIATSGNIHTAYKRRVSIVGDIVRAT